MGALIFSGFAILFFFVVWNRYQDKREKRQMIEKVEQDRRRVESEVFSLREEMSRRLKK